MLLRFIIMGENPKQSKAISPGENSFIPAGSGGRIKYIFFHSYTLCRGMFRTHSFVAFCESCICHDIHLQTAPVTLSLSSSAELMILLVKLKIHTSDIVFPETTPVDLTSVDDFASRCGIAVENRETPRYDYKHFWVNRVHSLTGVSVKVGKE